MTNHSGEKCLKHTPDTEWVTQFEKLTGRSIGEFDGVEATLWDVVYDYQTNQNSVAEEIVDFISSLLTSRDTYWKERVQSEQRKYNCPPDDGSAYEQGAWEACEAILDNLK